MRNKAAGLRGRAGQRGAAHRASRTRIVLVLAALLVPEFSASAEPVIGLLTELSGAFAANGADCRKGYAIALSAPAGEGVRPVFGDSQGDPRAALSELQKLMDVDRAAVVVANRSQVGMALAAVTDRHRLPLVGIVGHADFVSRYAGTLRAWPDARAEAQVLAQAAYRLGFRTVTCVTLEDEYAASLTQNFTSAFTALGGAARKGFTVSAGELDFRGLASAVRARKADVILVNLGIPQLGPFYKALAVLGGGGITLTNYWVQKPEVYGMAPQAAEGAVFVEAELAVPRFAAAFRERFGEPSNLMMSYTCYVGALAGIALAEAPAAPWPQSAAIGKIMTLDGAVDIRDRAVQFPLVAKRLHHGRAVPLLPAGFARASRP